MCYLDIQSKVTLQLLPFIYAESKLLAVLS
jgi:hypothetical protein